MDLEVKVLGLMPPGSAPIWYHRGNAILLEWRHKVVVDPIQYEYVALVKWPDGTTEEIQQDLIMFIDS